MSSGPNTPTPHDGLSLPTSLLLANNRKLTAAYVERTWLSEGCEYVGAFISATERYRYLVENIRVFPSLNVPGTPFHRAVWYLVTQQARARNVRTVLHYYVYNKIYRKEDDAYVLSHVQSSIANSIKHRVNTYSELFISECGSDPRRIYERIPWGASACQEDSRALEKTAMDLEWRV